MRIEVPCLLSTDGVSLGLGIIVVSKLRPPILSVLGGKYV